MLVLLPETVTFLLLSGLAMAFPSRARVVAARKSRVIREDLRISMRAIQLNVAAPQPDSERSTCRRPGRAGPGSHDRPRREPPLRPGGVLGRRARAERQRVQPSRPFLPQQVVAHALPHSSDNGRAR